MSEKLLVLSAIVFFPLIPAFLLFKLLPSKATVSGPLHGMEVKFGGAFGGYIALTIFLAMFFAQNLNGPAYRVWRVGGSLQFEPAGNAPAPSSNEIRCALRSSKLNVDINPGNTFNFEVPTTEDDLPLLVFHANGYEGETVYIGDVPYGATNYGAHIDRKTGRVTFDKPITLRRKSSGYQPTVAPVPVTGG